MLVQPLSLLASVILLTQVDPLSTPQKSRRVPLPGAADLAIEDPHGLSVPELLARMPTDPWSWDGETPILKPIPAEMRRRVEGGLLSPDEWRQALRLGDLIHTRARWPVGEPLVLWLPEVIWLREAEIRVRAVHPDLGEVAAKNMNFFGCGQALDFLRESRRGLALGAMPRGTKRVEFQVTIVQRVDPDSVGGSEDKPKCLWSGRVEMAIEAVPTIEDALPPTRSDAQDAAVRCALTAFWSKAGAWDPSAPTLRLNVYKEYEIVPSLRGVGLSLSIDLWHNGRSLLSTWLRANRGAGLGERYSGFSGYADFSRCAREEVSPEMDLTGWELHVTGMPTRTLDLWEADSWWNGSFVIPLAEALEHGKR